MSQGKKVQIREWVRSYVSLAVLIFPLTALAVSAHLVGKVLFERIVIMFFINLIMTLALQVFQGNSGVASFGQPGFKLLGAYGTILFTMTAAQKTFTLPDMPETWWLHQFHVPFVPSLLISACIAAVIGGVAGIPLIRIGAVSFGMASFALLIVIRIVALSTDALTRGTRTVVGITRLTTLWNSTAWALLFVVLAYLFKESGLGLKLRASRENESAAASLGIDIVRVRWEAWVLSIFMTAVGGGLWAHYVTVFSPHAFWIETTFLIMTMLIIGGQASVTGAVVGTVIVTLVSEGFRMLEYTINIQRQQISWIGRLFSGQVVGLSEFALAIILLLVLYRRASGITRGREFSWPFGRSPE